MDTFERYEKKYMLSPKQYLLIMERVGGCLTADRYASSRIHNIYYDTPSRLLIRRSLEKPVYKEKLRLRSYETATADSRVFIEMKKKYRDVVYKRRVEMPLWQAVSCLAGKESDRLREGTQIYRELMWMLQFYQNLEPAMYIYYERMAFVGRQDPLLRITFDSNLQWRDQDLDLRSGAYGNPLLEMGQRLMEVKIHQAMPLWLAKALEELEIYPCSFSKYGAAYRESLNNVATDNAVTNNAATNNAFKRLRNDRERKDRIRYA